MNKAPPPTRLKNPQNRKRFEKIEKSEQKILKVGRKQT